MGKQLDFDYHVCAVLFGTDETILDISLSNGFSFIKRSLLPKDNLDQVFDLSDIGLRRAYEAARINDSTLDVICIEKTISVPLVREKAAEYYDKQVDMDLVMLDNQIRAVRLVKECALRCKTVSFKMQAMGEYGPIGFTSMIPISESYGSPEISKFHCNSAEISTLNTLVSKISFPITNDIFNTAHRYYDLSYLEDNHIALTLLIVSLEMFFIKSEQRKKEKLAKRCAVFLHRNRIEQVDCFNQVKIAYKKRSDFVHDGVFTGIDDQTIVFLRSCVRKVLLTVDPNTYNKAQFTQKLKAIVNSLESSDPDYWTI